MRDGIFRTALLQKRSHGRDCERNTAEVLQAMEESARRQADILLLPECFLNGYEFPVDETDLLDESSPYLRKICEAAGVLSLGVVATALTKGIAGPRNTAWVVDKTGRRLLRYDKVHTCAFSDEQCLESGTEFSVCDFDGVRLGVMICYDREYPESARILMLKGAEIILVPNDCGSMRPRLQALSTRAYENMVGVAMANPPGENCGNSCAFSPICWDENGKCEDNTILCAGALTDGLFTADFDMDRIGGYRKREMMGNTFRRTEAYGELLNSKVEEPFIRAQGTL